MTAMYGPPLAQAPSTGFNSDFLSKMMGFSFLASVVGGGAGHVGMAGGPTNPYGYFWDSIRLFILGLVIETGRRFFRWVVDRVRFQYAIQASFVRGDPAFEWLTLFLTEAQVWKSSRNFRVSAKSSRRRWGVKASLRIPEPIKMSWFSSIYNIITTLAWGFHVPLVGDLTPDGKVAADTNIHAEFVPTYEAPLLFSWKGYWIEIKRQMATTGVNPPMGMNMNTQPLSMVYLKMYTNDINALSSFVEETRLEYVRTSKPHVIVRTAAQNSAGSAVFSWSTAKSKARRPLSSIILQDGVIQSLVDDAREFLESEEWYSSAGIPYRRGYLLWGPPGTGKSSTIYAIAGELGLEIFSLSLASTFVDDSYLQRAVAALPKNAIFLIEDIDCAFPIPRDDDSEDPPETYSPPLYPYARPGMPPGPPGMPMGTRMFPAGKRSLVTLSGLLNVLDGVGSEEGKIFFATTNYIDHLDSALLRPGRIDLKIQYKLATQAQAEALFLRFYPEEVVKRERDTAIKVEPTSSPSEKTVLAHLVTDFKSMRSSLAARFSSQIPAHEFSTAELQGYLLSRKGTPSLAADGASEWVQTEREDRKARKERQEAKKAKAKARREEREAKALVGGLKRIGLSVDVAPGGQVQSVTSNDAASSDLTTSSVVADSVGETAIPKDAGGPVTKHASTPPTPISGPPTPVSKPLVNGIGSSVQTNGIAAEG